VGIFSENDINIIKTHLSGLIDPLHLVLIKKEKECRYCREARELLTTFARYSDLLFVDIFDIDKDRKDIDKLKVEHVPAIIILDKALNDTGIRFYGVPGGYEFQSLLGAVLAVSKKRSNLPEDLIHHVQSIQTPLHIKTFVTSSCPYCPSIVRLIHKMALLNSRIQAEMIDVTEFPEVGLDAGIKGVPKTIINGTFELEGALPEDQFIEKIVRAFQ
jgi:glutaredoxin-like protein